MPQNTLAQLAAPRAQGLRLGGVGRLGSGATPARWSNPKLDPDAGAGQHIDTGLDAEKMKFAAGNIADPKPGHSE